MWKKLSKCTWIAIVIVVLMLFSACANGSAVPDDPDNDTPGNGTDDDPPALDIRDLNIGGGSPGGNWDMFNTRLGVFLQEEYDGLTVSLIEGGARSNLLLVNEGIDLDMSLTGLGDFLEGISGTEGFEGEDIDDALAVINVTAGTFQFAVLADSGIDSVYDLADKRILPSLRGFGTEKLTARMLAIHGITYDSIIDNGGSVNHVSWAEAPSLIKDGHADMATVKATVPNAQLMELETTHRVKVLGFGEAEINDFLNTYQGYYTVVIPAGSYNGQDEDAVTIGQADVFVANRNLPDQLVYDVVRLIMENADTLNEIMGVEIDVNDPFNLIDPENLHPGARRYYEEVGLL